ncbi:hypothetical protein, partial [Mesorhizobium sp. M8A.F.Ca.ET.161.01.1.1]|uniref:hypothetical protein n=1 Tax=Mesorhizobium sp. M8A.F.Ca.ET.161.01.1.1 TaxID=2563959 RepID=UPI001AEEB320
CSSDLEGKVAAVGRKGAIAASRSDVRFWTAAMISSMANLRRIAERQPWANLTIRRQAHKTDDVQFM